MTKRKKEKKKSYVSVIHSNSMAPPLILILNKPTNNIHWYWPETNIILML